MKDRALRWAGQRRRSEIIWPLLILGLGFIFFARNAHGQLASDDVGWLKGEAPTVFDQYRYLPRLFFIFLHALFGPSPVTALAMIFVFHSANIVGVYGLGEKLLNDRLAARVAALVFMINPLTLSTLTWISCFSYVLGASLALLSLLAFWKSAQGSRPWWWSMAAVAAYGAGLFSSHELLFLPAAFLGLGWLWGGAARRRGVWLCGLGLMLGALVNLLFYNFERYGVESRRLFSSAFVSAFVSSALSFGFSLGVAYPLSFFVPPPGFLQLAFAAPFRWAITLGLIAAGFLCYKPTHTWRLRLVVALCFVALITPYILRLYLMPAGVGYHLSYILSGRVFYLPFIALALIWGAGVSALYARFLKQWMSGWLPAALTGAVYAYALLVVYDRKDFMGLEVLRESVQSYPLPWNPYAGQPPLWLAGAILVVLVILVARSVALLARRQPDRSGGAPSKPRPTRADPG